MRFLRQTKGGSSFVDPEPSHPSPAVSPQGDAQKTSQEAASDNAEIQGAGSLYDVTTSHSHTVPTG